MLYKHFLRPLLFTFFSQDPENIHNLALRSLATVSHSPQLLKILKNLTRVDCEGLGQEVCGLKFSHPVGLAAGFDKNGRVAAAMEALGFSHVEIGTVTRYAQEGNPRPRLVRLDREQALINRMGFNNDGADAISQRLAYSRPVNIPVGINLGKSKITPLQEAVLDYEYSLRKLYRFGDYYVINVSSPNTPDLRKLQEKRYLQEIVFYLKKVLVELSHRPLFVKIAPDLTWEALDEILEVCLANRVDGIIATNTTLDRTRLQTVVDVEGGLSGRPLYSRSLEIVRYISQKTQGKLLIIGVGGISQAEQVYEMLKAGASLVQVYTGFIYEGPFLVRKLLMGLKELMKRDGIKSLADFKRGGV